MNKYEIVISKNIQKIKIMMLLDGLAYIGKRRTQMLMKIQGKSFQMFKFKRAKDTPFEFASFRSCLPRPIRSKKGMDKKK